MNIKIWYLKASDLFRGLPEEDFKKLDEMASMKRYDKGEAIYYYPEELRKVFLIKTGFVEVGKIDENGERHILEILGPMEFFGFLSMGGSGESYARALSDLLVCYFDEKELLSLLKRYPGLALNMIKIQSAQIKELETMNVLRSIKGLKSRLLHLIRSLYSKFHDDNGMIQVALTHHDFADILGCSRETVSILMSQLKEEGVLSYSRKGIRIITPEKLDEFLAKMEKSA